MPRAVTHLHHLRVSAVKDVVVPTPPPSRAVLPRDNTPTEVESVAELGDHVAAGTLAGLTVQGLRLDSGFPGLAGMDVTGTLFVGCRFASREVEVELTRRGATVIPEFVGVPYPTHPGHLYTPDDLSAGFAENGFTGMYDTVVYQHFMALGGTSPEIREALAQRLHDSGIDDALADLLQEWVAANGSDSVIGVMGGHAVRRDAATYRLAATLGYDLARAGRLVITGGGPGVMEAVNLGAFLCSRPPADLAAALDMLAAAPDFADHDPYTAAALAVRRRFPPLEVQWSYRGGLSIPTWLYGHEPANLFAARVAKYFSNATREDMILRLCRGGLVFAPGGAGTVQEVFQAATKTYYRTDGGSGPYVFLDRVFWTATVPAPALLHTLLSGTADGDLTRLIHITDDVAEAVALLVRP